MKENKFIKHFWRCQNCEEPLPKKGHVWQSRFQSWLQNMREDEMMTNDEVMRYPYYCDGCVSLVDKEG